MSAPTVNDVVDSSYQVDDSVVWDMYRALCGALTGSNRTEVWTDLTNRLMGESTISKTEDLLFKSAASLVLALRAEASGESAADALADAHAYLLEAVHLP